MRSAAGAAHDGEPDATRRAQAAIGPVETLLYVALALAALGGRAWTTGTALIENDAYQYASVARQLERTGRADTPIVHFDVERAHGVIPAPMTSFPPGYPALIAALEWTGMGPAAGGALLSAAAFVAVLLVLRAAGAALGFSRGIQRLTLLAWAVNAHAAEYGAAVMSEALFAALGTAGIALLLLPAAAARGWRPVLSGALIGLAYWVRYAGLFLAVPFAGYALWSSRRAGRARGSWLVALGACGALVAAGMARAALLTGTWRGGNVRFTAHPLLGRVRDLAVTQVSLVLGGISVRPRFVAFALLALGAAAVIGVTWGARVVRLRRWPRPAGVLLWFLGAYGAGIFYAALTTDISLSARMFLPVLPLLLLLAGTVAAAAGAPPSPRAARAGVVLRWAFVAGYLGTNVQAMAVGRSPPHLAAARALAAPAADGRPVRSWIEANVPRDAVLFALPGQALGYLLQRRTLSPVSGEYSDVRWEEGEVRLEMARFGARHLVILPGAVGVDGGADSAFLRQLAAGRAPGWLVLAAGSGRALVYRVREEAPVVGEAPGAPCVAAGGPAPLGVWVPALATGTARGLADAMTRVSPSERRPPSAATGACIVAGRGEHEPFQVVLPGGAGGLTGVRLAASDLVGPGGARIPATQVAIFREVFTRLPGRSTCGHRDRCGGDDSHGNRSLGPGEYADGLIPLTTWAGAPNPRAAPFDVPAGRVQPMWIEAFVPRGAGSPPGRYTGTIDVRSDQGSSSVPVTLTVWDFELPLVASERTVFGIGGVWKGAKNYENPACMEFLLRHKLAPRWLGPARGPAQARDFIPRLGLSATEPRGLGSRVERCRIRTLSRGDVPPASAFTRAAAPWPADLLLYVWTADEIGGKAPDNGACFYPDVIAWARAMHAGSRFQQLVTMYPAAPLLDDGLGGGRSAVDIWAPPASAFQRHRQDAAFVAAWRKGDQFWPYWGLAADAFAPRAMIDFPPLNNRQMVGFIAASLGVQGALYWQVDSWFRGHPRVPVDPWREVPVYVNGDGDTGYGDGALVYPGDAVGVGAECFAPTLRLEWIREGIEDYEYAQLARRAGVPDWLELVRTAALDYATWTKDPAVLAQARLALGRAIDARSR